MTLSATERLARQELFNRGLKKCCKCHETKRLDDFWACTAHSDGKQSKCKVCGTRPRILAAEAKRKELLVKGLKECSHCHENKTLDEFANRAKAYDGKNSRCKVCLPSYHRVLKDVSVKGTKARRAENDKLATEGMKRCAGCDTVKSHSVFNKSVSCNDGYASSCRECASAQKAAYAKRIRQNTRKYGLTSEEYIVLFNSQKGLCAVCKTPDAEGKWLSIDHDHTCCAGKKSCGKCVRGLLCRKHNIGLGNLDDSPEVLRAGAAYLENWADKVVALSDVYIQGVLF